MSWVGRGDKIAVCLSACLHLSVVACLCLPPSVRRCVSLPASFCPSLRVSAWLCLWVVSLSTPISVSNYLLVCLPPSVLWSVSLVCSFVCLCLSSSLSLFREKVVPLPQNKRTKNVTMLFFTSYQSKKKSNRGTREHTKSHEITDTHMHTHGLKICFCDSF